MRSDLNLTLELVRTVVVRWNNRGRRLWGNCKDRDEEKGKETERQKDGERETEIG